MISIDEINGLDRAEFLARFGGIYEHSPWVAASVADQRPIESRDALIAAMRAAVDAADTPAKLALIRAHPDLAGKLAMGSALTAASQKEQGGLGLDRLAPEEFALFQDLNSRYREKFGFPFVICVRRTDKAGILSAFHQRLEADQAAEQAAALNEIHHIAGLRLADLVQDEFPGHAV